MAAERWIFTKEQISRTPSRKNGVTEEKELYSRQQSATFIQSMGQKLKVNQLCINTAISYMHRFYTFQSLIRFPWRSMAPACLFLAAKVEEQPRKLEHVIKVAHYYLNKSDDRPQPPVLDPKSHEYLEKVQELVRNENILLQVLGFNVTIEHSNTHVIKLCQLVRAPRELTQTSYILSTHSLHFTTMCLQYKPQTVAAVCIYLACKRSNWELQKSSEGKDWWEYADGKLTAEWLEESAQEFVSVMEKADPKVKKSLMDSLKVSNDSTPSSRSASPAPHRTPQRAPSSTHPPPAVASVGGSGPHSSHTPTAGRPPSSNDPPKTYAEHKRIKSGQNVDPSQRARPPVESPLVRGDKRSHPDSSQHHGVTSSHRPPARPYDTYQQRSNHDRSSYHHHHNTESSPHKKQRLANSNGSESRPPLPCQPPLPNPPPPPPP